ncbi:hypothetical protein KZZ52_02400 [Dactylosporangium sp. AC04546]|uniref:hypothetical protein n=1 Tax=Dactylosporangium sp. AC04546 TaxID=2862460 RepID=UPI001EDDFC66|nr:hypothetical protein [Dactylosporangium sp. AC04546]WVK84305.1 hypothetical protein KZZ52_02400 [Dactylosporangium sp. AC04546]
MDRYRALLIGPTDGTWRITVPHAGEAVVTTPRLADFEARRLLGLSADHDVELIGPAGTPVYVFDILFTDVRDPALDVLASDPPAGCWLDPPALHCARPGLSRLAAIADLAAELRIGYGLEAGDLGFERLWEWAGPREWGERMVAHLLLMAVQRARWLGLPEEALTSFVHTAMP